MNQNTTLNRRQKGFTFTEILIVLAIIAGVTVLVLAQAGTAVTSGTVSRAASDIRAIVAAAQQYRSTNGGFGGMTLVGLNNLGQLPDNLTGSGAAGIGTNPWGGNYTVAVKGSTFAIGLTSVPDIATASQLSLQLGGDDNNCTNPSTTVACTGGGNAWTAMTLASWGYEFK